MSSIAYGQCKVNWSVQQQALKQVTKDKDFAYLPIAITLKKKSKNCVDFFIVKKISNFHFKGYRGKLPNDLYNNSLSPLSKKSNDSFLLPLDNGLTTKIWLKVPNPYLISPGYYTSNLQISAIKGNNYKVVKNKEASISYHVAPMASLSIKGAKLDNQYSKYNINFKNLKKGNTKKIQLVMRSNSLSNLIITSQNGGLLHTTHPNSRIEYEMKIKKNSFTPSITEKTKLFRHINYFGKSIEPLILTIKDNTSMKRAGDYMDQITLKIEVQL
jgi:hypothetical protein